MLHRLSCISSTAGQLISLAIYNNILLNINFPLALYKKLLDEPVDLKDLEELDPQLYKGLSALLTFDGDVATTFSRTLQLEVETLGGKLEIELVAGGKEKVVDESNRDGGCHCLNAPKRPNHGVVTAFLDTAEFVDLYADYIFTKSCHHAFQAFKKGFDSVLQQGNAIELFQAEELQNIVCGCPELDFAALEKNTQYEGFDGDTPVVRNFWEIIHELTEVEKKRFLFFTTGSDRVPVGGLGSLSFTIARNGGDCDRLPTSHTCYNVLLLNEYAGKEKLRERLLKALENSNCGFFLN
ncbi:putative E3 ubiquitin-protein ligase HTD2 [Rhizophlyctis rosea]|uniref:HECT-type E3 ubiquitin transferase n=1 Tax=Rhizophlyctis rosea TaxID=64517 RepID=A0AAD5SHE2_9FUNG|nr:putative E3 ubiquitin-protein ligase HTD2 [Rhizophlyctis rosea]